ncbi:MAG: hypothetical protein QF535_06845 [Anaerolineales bacterium]|jgi:hypothetical protein|nr:hypothetical protein [Anaerolineales bacterium]
MLSKLLNGAEIAIGGIVITALIGVATLIVVPYLLITGKARLEEVT